jgi:hypothetical protein
MSANIPPPPTWAAPVDPLTGTFAPVWIQWFLTIAQLVNQAGGSSGVQHNLLSGLQGGGANEFYHLTAAESVGMAAQSPATVAITGGSITGLTTLGFGTYTAGVVAQAGYITVKDSGGTTRRLLVG